MSAQRLLGIYIFSQDLERTLAFYELIGLPIDRISDFFARATLPEGGMIEFGTDELTHSYDPGWIRPAGLSNNTINLEVASREAVDSIYSTLVDAGHRGHLPPCDPPWQARFAIVIDPDDNLVGLHSPRSLEADQQRERGS
jgi:catechol 2,3-dioxygenase-like lactoylglutathione lyase family enzyme